MVISDYIHEWLWKDWIFRVIRWKGMDTRVHSVDDAHMDTRHYRDSRDIWYVPLSNTAISSSFFSIFYLKIGELFGHCRRVFEMAREMCRSQQLEPANQWSSWTENNVSLAYYGFIPPKKVYTLSLLYLVEFVVWFCLCEWLNSSYLSSCRW